MAAARRILQRSISAGMKVFKHACEIIGIGDIVEPNKFVCAVTSAYVFGFRYKPLCTISSVGSFITPSKFACLITSDYALVVA